MIPKQMGMAAMVPCPGVSARRRGPLLLLAAMVALAMILRGQRPGTGASAPAQDAFVGGAAPAISAAAPASGLTARQARSLASPLDFGESLGKVWKREKKLKYDGATKKQYIERLRWRREMSRNPYPRKFGYVEVWDDRVGEGLIRDQEKKQLYFTIRDEIGRCYHNHKTLQRAEFVEFFATDEIDEKMNLPFAKNVTGPLGEYVKGSEEYRIRMLRKGGFPKRWQDDEKEYLNRVGFYWLKKKWRNQ